MLSAYGTMVYGPDLRAEVRIDKEIVAYYFSLIPKYLYAKPQKYPPHITVVRLGKEKVLNLEQWRKYEGQRIEFEYSPLIQQEKTYFYLDAWSSQIGEIRKGLGLSEYREGFSYYHITIGNIKWTPIQTS